MFGFEPSDDQKTLVESVRRFAAAGAARPAHAQADERGELPPRSVRPPAGSSPSCPASLPEAYGGFGERSVVTGALFCGGAGLGRPVGRAGPARARPRRAAPSCCAGRETQKRELLPRFCGDGLRARLRRPPGAALRLRPARARRRAHGAGTATRTCWTAMKCNVALRGRGGVDARLRRGGRDHPGVPGAPGHARAPWWASASGTWGCARCPSTRSSCAAAACPPRSGWAATRARTWSALLNASRVALAALAVGVGARRLRVRARLREDAHGLRRGDRPAPGHRLHAGRDGDRDRGGAPAGLGGGLDCSTRAGTRRARPTWPRRFADDMALCVTDRAVQVLGGHGYIRDHPVELWLRNGRGFAVTGRARDRLREEAR